MTKYFFGQDGEIIDNTIMQEFELSAQEKEFIYSDDNLVYDFVGFIYKNDKLLVVFPKHYKDNLDAINDEDVVLLFKVMRKYIADPNSADAEKYYGYKNNYKSDYPFESFYKVYDYYMKHGLYKNSVIRDKINYNNRISWKTTMRRSSIIVSDGNLLYLPLYSKCEEEKNTFIGECMTFIINHTIDLFPFIGEVKRVNEMTNYIDLIKNRESVLKELYVYKGKSFKDSEIELINAIIQYLQEIKDVSNGGCIHIKIKYFNCVWERMINQYLNEYFGYFDKNSKKLIFNEDKTNSFYFKPKSMMIDPRYSNRNVIRPDFYYENDSSVYVFDAKYYEELNDIEYKQMAYTLLLGNRRLKGTKDICSALFLPGIKTNGLHVLLNEEFEQQKDGCNFILEQYMDVKKTMKKYLKK